MSQKIVLSTAKKRVAGYYRHWQRGQK